MDTLPADVRDGLRAVLARDYPAIALEDLNEEALLYWHRRGLSAQQMLRAALGKPIRPTRNGD